jgi:hypothetical protein
MVSKWCRLDQIARTALGAQTMVEIASKCGDSGVNQIARASD